MSPSLIDGLNSMKTLIQSNRALIESITAENKKLVEERGELTCTIDEKSRQAEQARVELDETARELAKALEKLTHVQKSEVEQIESLRSNCDELEKERSLLKKSNDESHKRVEELVAKLKSKCDEIDCK